MTKIRVGIVDIDVKYLRFFPGIASIFYFLPGIISTIIIMLNLILQGDVDLLIVNFWFLLSFTILNLLIAIGLFRKNIIAWWSAIIWPIVLLGYGFYWYIYCVNQAQMGNHSRTIELTLMTSAFIMQIGIYYLVGMMIIIPVEVKALFKKSTSDIAD